MSEVIERVVVTGGAGQIAYSLLFRIAAGELFGPKQKIALSLLEVPESLQPLKGVVMELEDGAFPLLKEVTFGSDPYQVFKGADVVFFVGAKPRGPGMERRDLLGENGKIFIEQGKAFGKVASQEAIALVVGNPCNTNGWILKKYSQREKVFAMTRLDQNRAVALLAKKVGVSVSNICRLTIWGNHSTTQVPDLLHSRILDRPALEVISDRNWYENVFIPTVQKRGAEVIAARGKSSAASAASAALDAMKSLLFPTPQGDWFSMGVHSKENGYGIDRDLIFSFPCVTTQRGEVRMVENLSWDSFLEEKIRLSEQELKEERKCVEDLV